MVSKEIVEEESPKELLVPRPIVSLRKREASNLPKLEITLIDLQWVQVLSEGWATPLTGFMTEDQYLQCLHFSVLMEGRNHSQSIPIVLPVTDSDKNRLENVKAVTLTYNGKDIAILRSPEFYEHRKEERCARVFGTTNVGHPVVRMVMDSGEWLVGGDIEVLERITWNDGLDTLRLAPKEIKKKLLEMKVINFIIF